MKRILVGAVLLALLAVPLMAVSAAPVCPDGPVDGGTWTKVNEGAEVGTTPDGYPVDGATQYCFKAGTERYRTIEEWRASRQDLSHWAYFIPDPTPPPPEACDENDSTTRVVQSVVKEPASDWVWDEQAQNFWRWLRVTTHIHAISDLDGSICDEGDVISREKETREADQPGVDINVGCNEDDVATISGSLDLGDFGVALVIEGRGSTHVIDTEGAFGPILARPGTYTWTIYGLGDNGRYVISSDEFEVADCAPEPPPEDCSNTGDNICPDDPPEHPPTGADPNTILPAVMSLSGFALMGIGGSILFMRRRGNSQ